MYSYFVYQIEKHCLKKYEYNYKTEYRKLLSFKEIHIQNKHHPRAFIYSVFYRDILNLTQFPIKLIYRMSSIERDILKLTQFPIKLISCLCCQRRKLFSTVTVLKSIRRPVWRNVTDFLIYYSFLQGHHGTFDKC